MTLSLIASPGDGLSGNGWDDFVAGQPDGTFCHLFGWSTVMAAAFGHECRYRAAVDPSGVVHAVLPLVTVRSRLFGNYIVSMPFLNYGGPIGSLEGKRLLSDEAAALAARSGIDLLELRGRSEVAGTSLSTHARKITVLLDLPKDASVLWKDGLSGKVRSQIRRPQKEGMATRFGADQMEAFYQVFAHNMRDLGTPVLGRRFFEEVTNSFPAMVEFGAVYLEDEPVAVGCGFLWKGEFEMTWASSLRQYNRMAPNMLLYWSFMERMIERGAEVFNFGRCTPGGGTHRFKSQWGSTRDVPLPWAQWSRAGTDATPNPDGSRLFTLGTRVWSRLPLTIANRLGPHLSRALP